MADMRLSMMMATFPRLAMCPLFRFLLLLLLLVVVMMVMLLMPAAMRSLRAGLDAGY